MSDSFPLIGTPTNSSVPDDVAYRDDIETIDPDEQETHAKIIQTMTDRRHISREKHGKSLRIARKRHGGSFLQVEFSTSDRQTACRPRRF